MLNVFRLSITKANEEVEERPGGNEDPRLVGLETNPVLVRGGHSDLIPPKFGH